MGSSVLVVTALEDVTADWVIALLNQRGVPWCVLIRRTSAWVCPSQLVSAQTVRCGPNGCAHRAAGRWAYRTAYGVGRRW